MEKITHYYITTEPPRICNDGEIEADDLLHLIDGEYKKIIAGLPNQPTIDYSALSDEDCKKIISVNFVALEKDYNIAIDEKFKEGFLFHKSLYDKKYNDDFFKWIDEEQIAREDGMWIKYFDGKDNYLTTLQLLELYNKQKKPKIIPIEAIVQENKVKILKVL